MIDIKLFFIWLKRIFKKTYFISCEIQDMEDNIIHYEIEVETPFYVIPIIGDVNRVIHRENKQINIKKIEVLCISKI